MNDTKSFRLDKKSGIPLWVQLQKRLVFLIVSGEYQEGDKLPTVRELAIQLDINYHTVNKVYRDLENDGLIEVQVGKGSFVTDVSKTSFIALESEADMVAADCAEKLLALGMTPERALQSVGKHLNINISFEKNDGRAIAHDNQSESIRDVG